MTKTLDQEKLNMWKKRAEEIEKRMSEVMIARGKAAEAGDLRENAAYIDATEEAEMLSAQLAGVQRLIKSLKEDK